MKHGSRNVMHACTMRFWEINQYERPSEVRETICRESKTLRTCGHTGKSAICVQRRKCFASSKKFRVSLPVLFASLSLYSREEIHSEGGKDKKKKICWISLESKRFQMKQNLVKMSSVMEDQQVRWVRYLRRARKRRKPKVCSPA